MFKSLKRWEENLIVILTMNLTMTVNPHVRVISSSLTPGFHRPDNRNYFERMGRFCGMFAIFMACDYEMSETRRSS